jgi:hypothetical protein
LIIFEVLLLHNMSKVNTNAWVREQLGEVIDAGSAMAGYYSICSLLAVLQAIYPKISAKERQDKVKFWMGQINRDLPQLRFGRGDFADDEIYAYLAKRFGKNILIWNATYQREVLQVEQLPMTAYLASGRILSRYEWLQSNFIADVQIIGHNNIHYLAVVPLDKLAMRREQERQDARLAHQLADQERQDEELARRLQVLY